MQLTFEFKDIEEAQEFLKGLTSAQPSSAEAPAATARVEVSPSKSSEPAKPSKAKKPKYPVFEPAPAAIAPAPQHTLDEVRKALSKLFDTKGRDPVADILKNAGAHSVSDLTPDLYAAVIADVEKALAK